MGRTPCLSAGQPRAGLPCGTISGVAAASGPGGHSPIPPVLGPAPGARPRPRSAPHTAILLGTGLCPGVPLQPGSERANARSSGVALQQGTRWQTAASTCLALLPAGSSPPASRRRVSSWRCSWGAGEARRGRHPGKGFPVPFSSPATATLYLFLLSRVHPPASSVSVGCCRHAGGAEWGQQLPLKPWYGGAGAVWPTQRQHRAGELGLKMFIARLCSRSSA